MKKVLLWLLIALLLCLPVLGLASCGGTSDGGGTNEPADEPTGDDTPGGAEGETPKDDGEGDVALDLPSLPSEREVTVISGNALHENTAELGRIPQGLAEVVNKYMTSYEAMALEGPLTTFQTSSYSKMQELPTDAVMAYSSSKESMASIVDAWEKVGDKYELHLMTIINRTNAAHEYMTSDPSRMDQVMTLKDGTKLTHSGTTYYMMPNEEWTEYVWSMVEIALDSADLKTIVFEEPDLFKDSGYSECFKREWEKYYGEPWQDQISSPEAMYKSQQLKIHLLEQMMTTLVERIKEKSPNTKVYIATHSTLSYNIVTFGGSNGVVSTVNYMLATGLLDGIIGQTWSDTSGAKLLQNGVTFQNNFYGGYLGYATYIDSVGDLDLYTLADPVGDGIGKNGRTEADYYEAYHDTIVAQMLQPAINRYQVMVWPSRSFEATSQDYRAVLLSVIKAQTEAAGLAAIQSAGTPGISYMLSDSLSYANNTQKTWGLSSNESFMGFTLPLLSDGIPLTITAMDSVKSAKDLEGINVLLLSFDAQKPQSEDVCTAIAEWIEQGGVCLYIGGHDSYNEMSDVWWGADSSPLEALFAILNLDINVEEMDLYENTTMDWLGNGKQAALEALNCPTGYNSFYTCFEGNTNAILELDGHVVGIDEQVGKGRLIALSLPTAMLAQTAGGSEVVRKLTEYACTYTDYKYDSTTLMWSKRGNVVAAYSIGQKNVLTGKYIDLFDSALSVHTHYVLEADSSALLYDITDFALTDTPRVAFSGGELTIKEESATRTHFSVDSPVNASVATSVLAPKGLYPQSIHAENYKGNIQLEAFCAWDSAAGALTVRVVGYERGVNVIIEWGSTPVESYGMQQPEDIKDFLPSLGATDVQRVSKDKTILTGVTAANGNSLDAEFIIRNTAKKDAERYYCDGNAEIIWCIDLEQYEDAYMAITVSQNYRLEVSTDGENWTIVQDFVKTNGAAIQAASNGAVYGIDSKVHAKDAAKMYVRLSNAAAPAGWGGAVSQYQIFYTAPVVPETDPADYAPVVKTLEELGVSYAKSHSVKVDSSARDASFLYINRAKVNATCRYCDATDELTYRIDLNKYPEAVVALQISQNYRIQVSSNDRTYYTVQDWIRAGNEWTKTAANMAYVIIDSTIYAPDAEYLYIKVDNAGEDSQGWGGAVYNMVIYHGGQIVLPDLPEISVKDYAPLAPDLSSCDAKYADRHKRVVKSNSYGADADFLFVNGAQVNANCRYCDGDRELVLRFDLRLYENAVIALDISQNYRVQISYDGSNFVTVQDWILAGNEWGQITTANRTYVIIDSEVYAKDLPVLYVKVDNAGADDQGWGGALHGFAIYYTGEKVEYNEVSIEDEVKGYLPTYADDAELRASLEAAYDTGKTIIVNTSYPNSDAAFVAPGGDTDKINELCKFCDAARSLTYQFDLSQYKDAVVLMEISNNYDVRVSTDRVTWTTVQHYVNANGGVRITNMGNKCWMVFDSAELAKDADVMYVRMGNCGDAGGYGGAVYQFTVFYNN